MDIMLFTSKSSVNSILKNFKSEFALFGDDQRDR